MFIAVNRATGWKVVKAKYILDDSRVIIFPFSRKFEQINHSIDQKSVFKGDENVNYFECA